MKLSTALTILALSSSASSVVGRKMAKGSKASKTEAEPEEVYLVVPAVDGKCTKGVTCIGERYGQSLGEEIDLMPCDNEDRMKWTIRTKGGNFKIRSVENDDLCIGVDRCETDWTSSGPSADLILRDCSDDEVWWYESQGVFYSSYCAFSKNANSFGSGPYEGRGAYYMAVDYGDMTMQLSQQPLDKKSSILVVSDLNAYKPFDLDKDSIKC